MPASWKLRVAAAAFPIALAAIACQAPSIEGTPYVGDTPVEAPSGGKKSSPAPSSSAADEAQRSTTSAQTRAAPVSTNDAGGVTPTPTPTTTAKPPPAQPSCGGPDLQACFFCCLDANPNAAPVEESYDSCLSSCVDQQCFDDCAAQHATACAASAPCSAHHACLQASGCFTSDS
jgi:hypothetical protein